MDNPIKVNRPLLLDLFCGAGGAGMGYYRAGFDVIGIDKKYQKHYPFRFIQWDLERGIPWPILWQQYQVLPSDITAYHASPPYRFATVDHKVPKSRGGNDDPKNFVLACLECNQAKDNLTDQEYRAKLKVIKSPATQE